MVLSGFVKYARYTLTPSGQGRYTLGRSWWRRIHKTKLYDIEYYFYPMSQDTRSGRSAFIIFASKQPDGLSH